MAFINTAIGQKDAAKVRHVDEKMSEVEVESFGLIHEGRRFRLVEVTPGFDNGDPPDQEI
ncbi:hypothetical protein H0H81_009948 [Sphagnurus paluster]|uniref:Uncharacterized protein n=1 Tax=Sphagnurus paluster TaxID=117069 RepID=A0A9P7GQD2_9AGAR|nr:hypothetical protein H0H81_009948 [Sphagnurus paluster]